MGIKSLTLDFLDLSGEIIAFLWYFTPLRDDVCPTSSVPGAEAVVHASLSVTAMSRVQQNLLFSSTYLQPTGRGDGALQVLVAGLWQGL